MSFSNALYGEYRHTGIKITLLCPGATKTEFARKANIALKPALLMRKSTGIFQLHICSIIKSTASSFDKSYKHILCLFQMPFMENTDIQE